MLHARAVQTPLVVANLHPTQCCPRVSRSRSAVRFWIAWNMRRSGWSRADRSVFRAGQDAACEAMGSPPFVHNSEKVQRRFWARVAPSGENRARLQRHLAKAPVQNWTVHVRRERAMADVARPYVT